MAVNEFEVDDVFGELNRKFANVSLDQSSFGYYKEIMSDDVKLTRRECVCHSNVNMIVV